MKLKLWIFNRIVIGMIIFFVLIGFWEFKWKPQYRPLYEEGVQHFHQGDYPMALTKLRAASDKAPNALDVILMMGWTNLKMKRFEEARVYFDRALRIDPRLREARLGAGFVALETGRGRIDTEMMHKDVTDHPADSDVKILYAGGLVQDGKNLEAARIYRQLLNDKDYGATARAELENLYGLKGSTDQVPNDELPPINRPAQLQMRYRASEGAMWQQGASGGWEKFYVSGVNLGTSAPGFFPGDPPEDTKVYGDWLRQAGEMNARAVRIFTLLPPAFYRAYKNQMSSGKAPALYQQILFSDPANRNLYEAKFMDEARAQVRDVVDALHGHGNVARRRGSSGGIYDSNIAGHVGAFILARDVTPAVAVRTNSINGDHKSYEGKYVTVSNATPTEVWFAEMMNYLITYEEDTYNWQHPVAIANWAGNEGLPHPTEEASEYHDAMVVDESKFHVTPKYGAGMFAAYGIYPYYPDFLLFESKYVNSRDNQGPNPMAGYIRDLKAHVPYPVVITEYGVPNSIGVARYQPINDWNEGGHSEVEQAQMLTRITRGLRDAGAAGGLVFELSDEWYKTTWITAGFEVPEDRRAIWLNELTPAKRFGMIGYHTRNWKLFAGDAAGWNSATTVYDSASTSSTGDGFDADRTVTGVKAAADEAFLYLRLQMKCLDCTGSAHDGKTHFAQAPLAVAINTLPDKAGSRKLPFGNVNLPSGANFLLYFGGDQARLMVADNYNPYETKPRGGWPTQPEISLRKSFTPSLGEAGFNDLVNEPNPPRYAPNGARFPGKQYDRSILRRGNGNPQAGDYDSLAEWNADARAGVILVRIPWGKLLYTDPTRRSVFSGFDGNSHVTTSSSDGVEISVFGLKPGANAADMGSATVASSLPAMNGSQGSKPKLYAWEPWDSVKLDPYVKKAYYAMQKEFAH